MPKKVIITKEEKPQPVVKKWVEHVKEYRTQNPTISYKQALKDASKTYK